MKLSEEELDRWFIELPVDVKRDFHNLWLFPVEGFSPNENINWDDIFKCESNTPTAEEKWHDKINAVQVAEDELIEFYDMAVNKYWT